MGLLLKHSFFKEGKGRHCWNVVEMPFHIYPSQPSFEEYVKNPVHRLSDNPQPENLIVFFDDFYSSGNTFRQCISDFNMLRYKKENLFFHSLSQYDLDRGSLTLNANGESLDLWNLGKDLKERLNQNN
jgi:hypothetical protein